MTLFEKLKLIRVKILRAFWQWRSGFVTKADLNFIADSPTKCQIGVVLSGGEFTPDSNQYGHSYGYPPKESIDYYISKGMKIIRFPFMWERVQPNMYGELDVLEMSRIDASVEYALSRGMTVGLDLHNGGYRFDELIGNHAVPDTAFADVWSKLAIHYRDKSNVLFMLMSEPHDQSARQWVCSANAAIAAIRKTGARQTIVVPGSYYDGGWTWCKSDNANRVLQVYDPYDNCMIEIHQYMDGDASGGTSGIVSPTIGADRLADVTAWARQHRKKLFLGEFAAASDHVSMNALEVMLKYVYNNSDVWYYATWWGGGDRWSNYIFQLDPRDYANPIDMPQMEVLRKFITS